MILVKFDKTSKACYNIKTLGEEMNFIPENRHLLVIPEEEAPTVGELNLIMPAEFKPPQSMYVVCTVKAIASDSKFGPFVENKKIVVERRMLHEIDFGSETIYLVLENYVFGRLQ